MELWDIYDAQRIYKTMYDSPVGHLTLASNGDALVGLWIEGQKYFQGSIKEEMISKGDLPIFTSTKDWLDRYFAGIQPSAAELNLNPAGSDFRQQVWRILCGIPYGKTITYGQIAREIAQMRGLSSMSAQAAGGAVGHNPISIIIPCHRVVGSDGSMTGYAGGIDKKIWLLKHENSLK